MLWVNIKMVWWRTLLGDFFNDLNPISGGQNYTNLYSIMYPDRRTVIFELHGGVLGLLIFWLETEMLPFKDIYP